MNVTDFFVNICIMCTLVFTYGQMIQNDKFKLKSKILTKVWIGFIGGIFGSVLITFGMIFPHGLVIDYRNIALTLSAMLGGEIAVILTGIIIGAFRILFYGVSITSIVGGLSVILSLLGCVIIVRIKMSGSKRWNLLFGYSSLCTLVAIIMVLVKDEYILAQSISRFIVVSLVGGYIAYTLYGYIMEVQSTYKRLKKEVENDYLTGLKNKRKFSENLEELIIELKEKEMTVGIIMFDIDHFKHINDTYGHLAGDAVLMELGKIARQNNKECEYCKGTYRIGGEEFAIIVVDKCTEEVIDRAEQLRKKVEDNTFILPSEENIHITISIGISMYPEITSSPYDLIKEADEALYHSKETGRNKVSFKGKVE